MKHPRLTRIFLDAIWKSRNPGFYVEIGAFDGRKKNSTIILEQIGWQGVCIEPTPESYGKLRENRKCRCENVALWKRKGFTEFATYESDPAWNGIVETLDSYHLDRMSEAKKIFVPTVTWDELKLPKEIDYLQIDVEGAEMAIMDCIDWDQQKITYICMEDNASKNGDTTYYEYMVSLGYECIVQQHVDYLWFKG